jgi:hypothetical protein
MILAAKDDAVILGGGPERRPDPMSRVQSDALDGHGRPQGGLLSHRSSTSQRACHLPARRLAGNPLKTGIFGMR